VIKVNPLEQTFKNKFNFNTEQYEIPPTDSAESLFNRLQAFIRCYDSPSKLGIIYYGGHAERIETENGVDLELFARRTVQDSFKTNISRTNTNLSELSLLESPVEGKGPFNVSNLPRPQQPHISYREFCAKIKTSETDMLLVVDSCHAAAAYTDEPFGGRKCELFCSIAEKDWARGPGEEGSFTEMLNTTLGEMIRETPEGFSTSDLYRRIYKKQHKQSKPSYFIQSKLDFGRIWLRPCQQKDQVAEALDDSKYTIDVRFHLTKSLDMMELNQVVKALQWIPFVQMVKMQNMHSPGDDLNDFIRTVYLASRMRPVLTRVRRKLEQQRARQLRQSDSSPPSPTKPTSEQFHLHLPRDVGLFDWSDTKAVTPNKERLTSNQYFDSSIKTSLKTSQIPVPLKIPAQPAVIDAALQVISREEEADVPDKPSGIALQRTCLSRRSLDRLSFFMMGVLAPTLITWAVQGRASPFAAL
jgi:hypothetical protein